MALVTKRHFDKRTGSRLQSQLKLTSAPIVEALVNNMISSQGLNHANDQIPSR